MNGKTNGIHWLRQCNVINSLKSNVHMIIDAQSLPDDQMLLNGDDAAEEYLIANDAEGNIDQIAAENLIFMARDGQMVTEIIETRTDENGTVVVSASDGTPIDYEAVLEQAALQQVVALASNNSDTASSNYVEEFIDDDTPQMVTEEVITDDWVQHQGEERVEITAEQIVGSGSQVLQEIEVPLPTIQDEYTALRPFPCDFCSRRFRKKSSLMNHMLSSHQNGKPHLCKLCSSRFFRRADLINHLKAHAEQENAEGLDVKHFGHFTNEPDPPQQLSSHVASDHYYDQDWHSTIAMNDDELHAKTNLKATNTISGNSSSTASSVNMPTVPRGRISRLKLKDYVAHNDQNETEEFQSTTNVADLEFIECQQLQASTAAVKLTQDQSPGNQKTFPIINDSKPFVCQQCGLAFAREKALLSHSKTHHIDTQLECNQCNEVFWDEHSLQEHQKTHKFEDSNSEYDPNEAEDSQSESDHGQIYAEYYCSECGISFHRQDLLRRHERTHLKKNNENSALDTAKTGQHCCNTCGETFAEALDLLAHAEIHARYPPFKCLLCGESFFEEETIQRHLQTVHANELTQNSCILCGKECRDRKALMKHAWDHSREKCHSCSKCGKNFHNKARLKRHMASHRDKSVTCDVCHEEFPDGRSLSNHRHSHSANSAGKLFPCHECGKTFGSRSSQQIHVRIHTGERPYGCRFCWKAFADGGTLRKHERIHTGEKPYACSVCPRAFNQRVVLREHIRSHHSGMDPKRGTYFCTVCSAELTSPNDLIQHLIGHSDKNTAMQRAPVTGPRKYKRRRKLKPHEIAHLRNESKQKGDGSDIDIADFDMENVDDLLGLTENSSAGISNNESVKRKVAGVSGVGKGKGGKGKTAAADYEEEEDEEEDDENDSDDQHDDDDEDEEFIDVNNSGSSSNDRKWQGNSMRTNNNKRKELFRSYDATETRQTRSRADDSSTAQRTHQVQYIKVDHTVAAARTTANTKTRKKTEKLTNSTRPRMIHTEKIQDNNRKRGGKTQVTRTTTTSNNINLLSVGSSSSTATSTIVDDYEIISPATQPPNQISSSPLHIKQEQHEMPITHRPIYHHHTEDIQPHYSSLSTKQQPQQLAGQSVRNTDLYDAQLLLEAANLRKNIYEKFNPSIVNDLEEILGSPIKTDKNERERFTSESSTTQFLAEQSEEEQNLIKIEPTSPDLQEIVAYRSSIVGNNDNRKSVDTLNTSSRSSIVSANRKYLDFDGSRSNQNGSGISMVSQQKPTSSMPNRSTANHFNMRSTPTSISRVTMPKSPMSTLIKTTNTNTSPSTTTYHHHTNFTDDAFSSSSVVDTSSYFSISAVVSAAESTAAAAEAAANTAKGQRRQRMFECEMCSAVFSDRAQLLDHVHIHI